jgi:hypothetical protein
MKDERTKKKDIAYFVLRNRLVTNYAIRNTKHETADYQTMRLSDYATKMA